MWFNIDNLMKGNEESAVHSLATVGKNVNPLRFGDKRMACVLAASPLQVRVILHSFASFVSRMILV